MGGKKIIENVISEAQDLSVYDVGETIRGLALKVGKEESEILKLNSNENFFVPLDFIRSILRQVIEEVDPRVYPRDEFKELREAIGKRHDIPPDNVVIGTGSDQLIDLTSRIFLRSGDEALSIEPTFAIYERSVRIQGAFYRRIPLRCDFSLDVDKMLSSISPRTKVIFLCSPNNPTANQLGREEILRLAENFNGLVAVDEAYADFAAATLLDAASDLENLIVFRTFSKVFGLAGLRVGYAVANNRLAKIINERFQMPYMVSVTALKAAVKMLEKMEYIRELVSELKIERSKLIDALNGIRGVRAFPSETNFVLFQVNRDSTSVYRALLERGIIIREVGSVLKFRNCLRVTVAPDPMMNRFITMLREVLDEDA
ncbi:MAG: histidinol-phosphate transaminase [Candidatus Bathyarchaeia archaeon]|nr:histidinol-phosphate transaminase [Candidatus Bathyarchaeota archaeon]